MNRRLKLALLVLSLAAMLGMITVLYSACETPLSPTYQLTQPRILAIRSDPPDLLPDSGVALDALLYLPPGSPTPTYQWSWCATLGSTLECTTDAAALQDLLDDASESDAGVINYTLGSKATATFDYPVNPAYIEDVCARVLPGAVDSGLDDASDDDASADASPFELDGAVVPRLSGLTCGTNSWTVNVLLTVTVGATTLQATRQVTAYLTPPPTTNTNPTILGLHPFSTSLPKDAGALANPDDEADGGVDDAGVGSVSAGGTILGAVIPLSATDIYAAAVRGDGGEVPDAALGPCEADAASDAGEDLDSSVPDASPVDASPVDAGSHDAGHEDAGHDAAPPPVRMCLPPAGELFERESLTLAWYVEGGELDHATTTLSAAFVGAPQDWSSLLLNRWVPPASAGSTQFILVVRDNRGGVGWLTTTGQASP